MLVQPEEVKLIEDRYPGLLYTRGKETDTLSGSFLFAAAYDAEKFEYILNPKEDAYDNYVKDSYLIEISIPHDPIESPSVREVGGKIPTDIDYHKYSDGTLCLTGPFDTINDKSLLEILNGPVLQFFYDQSYSQKYKLPRPRGEYSHFTLGLLENYVDKGMVGIEDECLDLLQKQHDWGIYKRILYGGHIKGHRLCPCGNNKKFRDCHEKSFHGIWNLQKYITNKRN